MNVPKFTEIAVAAVAVVVAFPSFGAEPVPSAGGEYTYSTSYGNDMRTKGQTGDQIWNIASPVTIANFYPGQTDAVDYWQIYRGESITDSGSQSRIMKGNVVFENAVKWTGGAQNYVGYTGPVKLMLRNGGSFTSSNSGGFRIGQSDNSGTAGTATIFMEEPSALTANGTFLNICNGLPAAVWMDGGVMSLTNGTFSLGGGAITADGGYLRLNGGEVSLRSEATAAALAARIGRSDSRIDVYSSIHISGGKFATRRTGGVGSEVFIKVAEGANKATDIYVDGGVLDLWNERLGLGYWGGVSGGRASLTVDGGGRVVMSIVAMGRTGSGNASVVNVNGGRLEMVNSSGFSSYGNTGNRRYVNFDGGTLALVKDSRTPSEIGALATTGDKVVYPGGGAIEVPSGITANVTASTMRKAAGYGVSEITLTNPGSGYVTAPKVTITGGVGSNATAYAILNKDRTLEKIVVTCRGEGYAAGDSVTVTISSATGSGAAATATLASNAGGVLRKTGAGAWQQQTNDNSFDGEIEVAEGSLKLNGAGFPSASLNVRPGATLLPVKGTASLVGRLVVTNGIAEIKADGSSGTATLNIGSLSVNQGLALVTHTNSLALALTATDSTTASSSASPVVNGLVYANKDASKYRSPLPFERAADGSLSLVTTSTTPGPDANWRPTSDYSTENAPEVSEVNSIIMRLSNAPGLDCYVKNSGNIEIKSGMIVCQRPHAGTIRMNVTGGGAFTTRAKDGMFIYSDNYEIGKRSYSTANDNAVFVDKWRRLYGPFADPDANTPMALTVAGEKQSRPELGAQAWLLGVQSFSGGLNLVNGGVFVSADSGLGASGSPVRASGYCSIGVRYSDGAFDVSHPIELLEGSALIFSPELATGNSVSGSLSGSGDLLTSDVNRRGSAMAFTGDHSAFTGDYYIQGHARIAPAIFSANAGIKLADGTNGVGVIETAGSFTRPVGTGKGEICWKRFKAYPSSYALRGGFAAFGGDLTVNLGGEGAKLAVGSDYLPNNAVVQLQSQYADGALTFANGFELGGKTQKVNVWNGKTATISGAVSDEVGGGVLAVTGNLDFAGTLEVAAANIAAGAAMATVDGDLAFSDDAIMQLPASVTPETLAAYKEAGLPLFMVGGTVTGRPALDAPGLGGKWHLRVKNGVVSLLETKGLSIIIK